MGVFVILFFVPLLLQHAVVGIKIVDYEKKNRRALLWFFIIFTVLVMLRHESVGNDTRNYIMYFDTYKRMDWRDVFKYSFEIGFSYYIKMIAVFTDSAQVFLAVTGIITVAFIYPTYKRLCVDTSLTIVLFGIMSTFVMMFSGIRQMMAIGIGFIAYEFTRNKKLIPFIVAVLIAILFHTSAVMLAVMYPLYHAKITRKWLLVVVPAIIFVFIFNRQIFSRLAWIIDRYTEYDSAIIETGAYTMIVMFAVLAVFSFLIPDDSRLDAETLGLRNFLLWALVLQMFAPLHTVAMRLNYYYIIFIPLLLPKIIECKSERWKQVAVLGRHIMVVSFLLYFFISSSRGALHVFPYHFFWETV